MTLNKKKYNYAVTVGKNHYRVVWPGCRLTDSWRATGYEIDLYVLRFFLKKIIFLRKQAEVHGKT